MNLAASHNVGQASRLSGRKRRTTITLPRDDTWTTLANLSTATNNSGAWGLNADAGGSGVRQYVAGYSQTNSLLRPVVWERPVAGSFGQPMDLGGAGTLLPLAGAGHAYGVNPAGEIVGQAQLIVGTGTNTAWRAFRSKNVNGGSAQTLAAGDELPPLVDQSDLNNTAVAWNINAAGVAVGSSIVTDPIFGSVKTNAVYWAARSGTGTANPAASLLQSIYRMPVKQSDANAINTATTPWIVGWSYDGIANHATLWTSASTSTTPYNLDDAHFIYPTTGWKLESAMSVNNAGWIIGNGTLNGVKRAFLLVPQVQGN